MVHLEEAQKHRAEKSLDVIQNIREARIREGQNREKVYMHVATGALVLSISFLTTSGPEPIFGGNVLVWSWIVLLGSIVLRLVAAVLVDRHFYVYEREVREWRKQGMGMDNVPSETSTWTNATWWTNYVSYTLTIVGLILMSIFGINNINYMSSNNNMTHGTDGKITNEPDVREKFAEPTVPGAALSDFLEAEQTPTSEATDTAHE